jgi:hypothetical protein
MLCNCAGCHRPGQSGPFPLLDYASVKKRSRLIAGVAGRKFMPPWQPHYYLGLLLRQQNQLIAAPQEFQTAVRLNPASYKSYGNLGFIAEQQGHWAEAEKQFRRVLEI